MFDFEGYGPSIFGGGILTIELAVLSLILAFTLGLLGALGRMSKSRVAKSISIFYTTIIRGIPDLVWMMLLFFGGQILVNMFFDWIYNISDGEIDIFLPFNEFVSGVLTH